MEHIVNKFWNYFTSLMIVIVVMLAIALVGVRVIGLKPYMVLSGSMEPTYRVGSLIYVKETDYRKLQKNDPITYMLNENTIVTHRIVEVVQDPDEPETIRFRTKGDANNAADGSLVHYKNVIGKPVFSIPWLGYLSNYIQNPPGTYIAIAAGALLMLLVFLPDVFSDGKKGSK